VQTHPVVALVDDDKIYQFTAVKTLQLTKAVGEILPFLTAEDALDFLRSNASNASQLPDYIFLDINMPVMDGWAFLDDFDKLAATLAKPVTIYMVSSSIDPKDVTRATDNPYVRQYVTKPVTIEKFRQLINVAG